MTQIPEPEDRHNRAGTAGRLKGNLAALFRRKPKQKVLVVEGGGMRAIFAIGVLQAFHDAGFFPWKLILGTSAGAMAAVAYAARKIQVVRDAMFMHLLSGEFITVSNLLRPSRHVIDLDGIIECIFEAGDSFQPALKKSCPVLISATCFYDDRPPGVLFLNSRNDDLRAALKSTSALPVLYKEFVHYKGHQLLDGGIVAPVPYPKAVELGFREKDIVVITTRKKGYRKKTVSFSERIIYETFFKDDQYRFLLKALYERPAAYNSALDDLEQNHVDIRVIYPPADFSVERLTKEAGKTMAGFVQGVQAGNRFLQNL